MPGGRQSSLGSLTRNDTVSELLRGAPSGAGYATGVVRARTVPRDIWSGVDSGQPPARHLGDHRQQPRAGRDELPAAMLARCALEENARSSGRVESYCTVPYII